MIKFNREKRNNRICNGCKKPDAYHYENDTVLTIKTDNNEIVLCDNCAYTLYNVLSIATTEESLYLCGGVEFGND